MLATSAAASRRSHDARYAAVGRRSISTRTVAAPLCRVQRRPVAANSSSISAFCALSSAMKRRIPLARAYSARLSNSKVATP